jgi:hypothetical protein
MKKLFWKFVDWVETFRPIKKKVVTSKKAQGENPDPSPPIIPLPPK